MQEVLNDIAFMYKAGPHKDLWEIKREYRTGGPAKLLGS